MGVLSSGPADAAGAAHAERRPCRADRPGSRGSCAGAPVRRGAAASVCRPVPCPPAGRATLRPMRYLGVDVGRVPDRARPRRRRPPDRATASRAVARRDEAATLADIGGHRARVRGRAARASGSRSTWTAARAPRRGTRARSPPKLEAALGIPAALFDERLSTFEAETRLRDQGFSAKDRRSRVDAEAAAVILQGWLDAESSG